MTPKKGRKLPHDPNEEPTTPPPQEPLDGATKRRPEPSSPARPPAERGEEDGLEFDLDTGAEHTTAAPGVPGGSGAPEAGAAPTEAPETVPLGETDAGGTRAPVDPTEPLEPNAGDTLVRRLPAGQRPPSGRAGDSGREGHPDRSSDADRIDDSGRTAGSSDPGLATDDPTRVHGETLPAGRTLVPESDSGLDSRTRSSTSDSRSITPTAPLHRDAAGRPTGEGGPAEPTELFAGRFEVSRVLGEGGMGKVYLVRDHQIEGRKVALKVLRPRYSRNERFRKLFFKEIDAASRFVSENVVQVRDTGQMDDGKLFLTMDYVPGEDLRHLLRREKTLSERHALEVVRQMLAGLHSGHEQGFVHRDIKPGNVMMASRVPKTDDNPFGVGVRLLDFGIADLAAELEEGTSAGTPMYMSPEQAQGQRLDPRSDLFAVGLVLYEILAGRRPFEGETRDEVIQSVIDTNLVPAVNALENISPGLRKILRKALQKDRNKRFQSAQEFKHAVENSKAFREAQDVSPLMAGALVVMTGVAGFCGYSWWQASQRNSDLAEDVRGARAELIREQDRGDQLDRDLLQRDRELNEARRKETAAAEARKVEQGAREGIAELAGKYERDQVASLTMELKQLNDRVAEQKAEIDRLTGELEQVRGTQDVVAASNSDVGRHARLFDGVLDRWRNFGAQVALQYFDRERVRLDVFPATSFESIFLHDALSVGQQVDAIEAAVTEGQRFPVAPLSATGQALGRLDVEAFEVAANRSEWPRFKLPTESEAKPRLGSLRPLFEGLSTRLSALAAQREQFQSSEVEAIAAGPNDQLPARAWSYYQDFGELELVSQLLVRYVAHLRETVERDGKLLERPLSESAALEPWSQIALEHREALGPPAHELLVYWYAYQWWVAKADQLWPDDAPFAPSASAVPADGQPHDDWRALLALQYQLYRSLADGVAPFVQQFGSSWSYDDENHTWQRDELLESDGPGTWTVQRRFFYSVPGRLANPITLEIERAGDRIAFSNIRLDLRSSELPVGSWAPPPLDQLKAPKGTRAAPNREDLEHYWNDRGRGPYPCILVKSGDHIHWIQPGLGHVREQRGAEVGTLSREFVYFGH